MRLFEAYREPANMVITCRMTVRTAVCIKTTVLNMM